MWPEKSREVKFAERNKTKSRAKKMSGKSREVLRYFLRARHFLYAEFSAFKIIVMFNLVT